MAALVYASCAPDDIQPDDKEDVENKDPDKEDPGKEDEGNKEDTPGVDNTFTELVDSLKTVLYRQTRAMQLVLTAENIQISACNQTEIEGLYEVSLSTGASFIAYVDEDDIFTDVLTYVESDGQKCWAVNDKEGNAVAIEDKAGKKLALTSSVDVDIVDRKYYLKSEDASYDLGYTMDDKVQMFEFKPLVDNSGAVYAIEFNFGSSKKKLVYVEGYAGLYFYLPSDQTKTSVTELYVNTEGKASVAVSLAGDFAWKPVVGEGWTAQIREEEQIVYVDITAPDQVEYAETLQLKAVSEEGSFEFSSVSLTDVRFHSLTVSVTDAVISPSTGLGKFAYGITLLSDFNADAVLEIGLGLISGAVTEADGCGVSEVAVSEAFADILGEQLDSEERYVLWAVADGLLSYVEFGEIAVDVDVKSVSLLDAEVEININGAEALFGGVMEKSDTMLEEILYQVNNDIYEPLDISQVYDYSGAASEFTMLSGVKNELYPSTTYVVWVVPAVDGDYVYGEKDVIYMEFTTNPIVEGGSLELTCSDVTATPSSLSFDLSCDGAAMIYYAFFTETGGGIYSDPSVPDNVKFEQIISEDSDIRVGGFTEVVGDKVTAVGTNLNDEAATTYWMYAVAVDKDGKYGKVHCVSAQTLVLAYDNTISLSVDVSEVTATSAVFKVTSNGGDLSDYIYWVGRSSDPFWANTAYCGATKNTAQKYMALNPDDENIVKAMRKYGPLSPDGTLKVEGMTMETKYVLVILEKGDVYYSPAGYKIVTTLAADLGDIVRTGTDKWNEAMSMIHFDWHKESFEQPPHLMATYAFAITCPKDFTSYVMCASEDYFTEMGLTKVEHHMIELETYAGRRVDKDHTVYDEKGNMRNEPDYYKGGVKKEGQLMSVNDFYVHGIPCEGTVTYFAEGTHGEDGCHTWNGGVCENYARAEQKIAYYRSEEPWKIRATSFGLEGQEAADWVEALKNAYYELYKDVKPLLYINDGSPLEMTNPYGTGVNDDGVVPDRVIVMLKDRQGNYYEPMYFEVPNYFEEK